MIRDISDLLKGIMDEEKAKLDSYSLKHGPTIGRMYEGLTSDILSRAVPTSLGLQLRHGIIHDGQGTMSGEIDCMLVKGNGEKIPYTDSYKWHVKDVIAVIEVKKTLYSADLRDSFNHLKTVVDNYGSYLRNGEGNETFNINPARRAFSEATGIIPPTHKNVSSMGIENQVLYHTFVMEQLSPIRIVLGYHGFKKEASIREALIEFLSKNLMEDGFGVNSFPQLITCGKYSLIKTNGFPYSSPMTTKYWDFYGSSRANPVLLILELIWTRLSREIKVQDLWGKDLHIENFARLLSGRVIKKGDKVGWEYMHSSFSEQELKEIPPTDEWSPIFVSSPQFVIFNKLCNGDTESINDKSLIQFIENEGENFADFIQSLLNTGLIALNGDKLELTTHECQCAIVPNGGFVVAENNSGRFSRWIAKEMKKSKA